MKIKVTIRSSKSHGMGPKHIAHGPGCGFLLNWNGKKEPDGWMEESIHGETYGIKTSAETR